MIVFMGRGGCEPSADSEYPALFRWGNQAVVCKSGGVCFLESGRWESWDVVNSSFSCTWRSRFEDEILYVHLGQIWFFQQARPKIVQAEAFQNTKPYHWDSRSWIRALILDMRRKPGCPSATMRSKWRKTCEEEAVGPRQSRWWFVIVLWRWLLADLGNYMIIMGYYHYYHNSPSQP